MSSTIRLFIKFTLGGGGEFMNGSTLCEIKYMKGYFVYDSDWGWSENTGSHPYQNYPQVSPPCPHPSPKRDLYLSKNVP